ncbi:MAG: hypothetical protein AB8F78_14070 [Saprospiraceae bacterium]
MRVLATATTTHAKCACVGRRERVFGSKGGVTVVVHGSSFIVPGLVT